MNANEAIGILRSQIGPSSVLHREIAENMGADALEFQGWLFSYEDDMGHKLLKMYKLLQCWNGEDSFLDFALGEWRKEEVMDSKRAAEVLRDPGNHGPEEKFAARDVAIQALEAWAWVEQRKPNFHWNDGLVTGAVTCAVRELTDRKATNNYYGPTPLAAVLDAMEKEGKG